MSLSKRDRKIRSVSGKDFPPGGTGPTSSGQFATAIAQALRRQFGPTHAAVKSVAALTGANERAVKNWIAAKNGPSGEHLIDLMRHSGEVLETVLLLAGLDQLVAAKKFVDARQQLDEMIANLESIRSRSSEGRG